MTGSTQAAAGSGVRLSTFSHGAGCACKLGPGELAQVLRHLPAGTNPDILVDAALSDDAAVIKLSDDRALVLTTDFFTPIVDDPFAFGQIAAANAISDVYAMGGRPLYCLNLVGWPRETLSLDVLGEVLRGAADIVAKAGAFMVGGHSIDDPEPKFGLVAVGEVDPRCVTTNAAAKPGDVLVLTKPIGSGVIATAIKREKAPEESVTAAIASMTTLNRDAAEAGRDAGVRAATDVTGFGLLGHLRSMMKASKCAAELDAAAVPLMPGARALAEGGCISGGTRRNFEFVSPTTTFPDGMDQITRLLLADAQTSGGLLLCTPAANVAGLVADLKRRGTPAAAVVGRVVAGEPGAIRVM
ncbi:MAG TPA: selenide, water dikinase SelD [Gemmatimonadales bacterium]